MALEISKLVKTKKPIDSFTEKVIRLIMAIPRGRVATYGQIAEIAGKPSRSRSVGFILRTVIDTGCVPWQRVIGSDGKIAFPKRNKNFKLQRKLLEGEGVVFSGTKIDFDRYRWRRKAKTAKGRAQPRMFSW